MYNRIVEELSKTQTTEAAVCRVINSRMSKQGLTSLILPSDLIFSIGQGNPHSDLIIVSFHSPTEIKRDYNNQIIKKHYGFEKPRSNQEARVELEGDKVYLQMLPEGIKYCVGTFGDEAIHCFEWPLRASKTASKKAKEPKPVKGIMTNLEASQLLEGTMRIMPIGLIGRHSHNGKLIEKYVYVQTLTEYAFALGLNEREIGGKWLTTHIRTRLPLPWGGISTERKTPSAKSEEDKLQIQGKDLELFDREIPNIHRKTPLKGKASIDVKLISSVGEPCYGEKRYTDVPVEALTEVINLPFDSLNKYNFYDENLWTWDEDSKADIGYVLRNHAYLVPKARLREAVKKRVERVRLLRMEPNSGLRPNTFENGKLRKWCAWFSETEIAAMATVDFQLPSIYGELLEQHALELLDLYDDKDKGDNYTCRQLRYFKNNI